MFKGGEGLAHLWCVQNGTRLHSMLDGFAFGGRDAAESATSKDEKNSSH